MRRAIAAAKAEGARVEILPDGTIRLIPIESTAAPAQPLPEEPEIVL